MKVYPKSSYDSARAHASRLVADGNISAEIERRLKERQLSSDEVLARLGDMARSDIANFVGIEKPSDLLDEEYRGKTHVIKKFKHTVTTTRDKDDRETVNEYTELELYDARSTLVDLGKANGALGKDTGSEDKPFIVKVIKGVSTDDL